MNKIPTAEEFVNQYDWENSSLDIPNVLREFAKLHVAAALKAASENADAGYTVIALDENEPNIGDSIEVYVITSSILNAYPLDNIK